MSNLSLSHKSSESENLFIDRFDTRYLIELRNSLDRENLKKTAIDDGKEIGGTWYPKCININFCGLAASTLFLSNNQDKININDRNINLRREVSDAFLSLFTKESLEGFNKDTEQGPFYLRVRFCFSYLYADYPICLIKAEDPKIWENLVNKPIDNFYLNKPVKEPEFDKSHISRHQVNSLSGIINILDGNRELIFLGKDAEKVNTIQIRFNVIPSPFCALMVNSSAFCDTYMYAMAGDQIALNFPVIKFSNEDPFQKGFSAIKAHFHYLWRHDLTLFCEDATEYKPEEEEIEGLIHVLKPDVISGTGGTNWKYKIERIWERKMGRNADKTEKDLKEIEQWKFNVNKKFQACTRKLKKSDEIETESSIRIGMKKKYFWFRIYIKEADVEFEYLSPSANNTFKLIAHYSYAEATGEKAWMITNAKLDYKDFLVEIKKSLNTVDLDRNDNGTKHFDKLFDEILENNVNNLRLKITKHFIDFDANAYDEISKLTYNTKHRDPEKSKEGCLKYKKGTR